MIKNISPAQREKPNNDVEIMINGELVVDLLEKELIALSGNCFYLLQITGVFLYLKIR